MSRQLPDVRGALALAGGLACWVGIGIHLFVRGVTTTSTAGSAGLVTAGVAVLLLFALGAATLGLRVRANRRVPAGRHAAGALRTSWRGDD